MSSREAVGRRVARAIAKAYTDHCAGMAEAGCKTELAHQLAMMALQVDLDGALAALPGSGQSELPVLKVVPTVPPICANAGHWN